MLSLLALPWVAGAAQLHLPATAPNPPVALARVNFQFNADLPASGGAAGITVDGTFVQLKDPGAGAIPTPVGGDMVRFVRQDNRTAVLDITTLSFFPAPDQLCTTNPGVTGEKDYTYSFTAIPGAVVGFGATGFAATSVVSGGESVTNCGCASRRVKGITMPVSPGGTDMGRLPMDLILVLDQSGSMILPAATGAPVSRWAALQSAVGQFVANWATEGMTSDPNSGYARDRLGVVYFDTNAAQALAGGFYVNRGVAPPGPTHAWKPYETDVLAENPKDLTALGKGLLIAIDQRNKFPGNDATVVVMTDGMQNVDPLVRRAMAGPNAPYLVLDTDGTITGTGGATEVALRSQCLPMLAVSVGDIASPWAELLERIAAETAGTHKLTRGSELPATFLAQLTEALKGNTLTLALNQSGALPQGTNSVTTSVLLDGSVRNALITLGTVGAQNQERLSLRIISPDGVQIRPTARMDGPTYTTQRIDIPATGKPGTWKLMAVREGSGGGSTDGGVIITGASLPPTPYQFTVLAEERSLDMRTRVLGTPHVAGEKLTLAVDLSFNGKPLETVDGKLTARVEHPNAPIGTVLRDTKNPETRPDQSKDPRTAYQQKVDALLLDPKVAGQLGTTTDKNALDLAAQGKGRYTLDFPDTKIPGLYRFHVTLDIKNPDTGDLIHRVETVETTVVVGSDGTVSEVKSEAVDATTFKISFTPKDAAGNFKGPGFENQIQVRIDGKGEVVEIRDPLINGTYEITIKGIDANTNVVVFVAGQPIAKGPVSKPNPMKPGEPVDDKPDGGHPSCGCRRMGGGKGTAGMLGLFFLAFIARRRGRRGNE
ncbi:VWA domain-containing protein [Corallococcus llansteffanensis]|uniref:VWA domain-containing protein n=1 Tax=Corallococcus llansteffanensis TaxID=2316731 RepID=A0A3A8PPY2_9BACT|nr:VWA domain-containing protein [Corallococcus llansteffanensis]